MEESEKAKEFINMAVMWHLVSVLPLLRLLPFDTLKVIGGEASEVSNRYPLQYCMSHQFSIPTFRADQKVSGGMVIALMIGCLWVMCGENPEMCHSLYTSWPCIKEALILSPKESES